MSRAKKGKGLHMKRDIAGVCTHTLTRLGQITLATDKKNQAVMCTARLDHKKYLEPVWKPRNLATVTKVGFICCQWWSSRARCSHYKRDAATCVSNHLRKWSDHKTHLTPLRHVSVFGPGMLSSRAIQSFWKRHCGKGISIGHWCTSPSFSFVPSDRINNWKPHNSRPHTADIIIIKQNICRFPLNIWSVQLL